MTAQMQWFNGSTVTSLVEFGLVKPGFTSSSFTRSVKNTGTEPLGSIQIIVQRAGTSTANDWVSGTAQAFDADGVDVGSPAAFDFDTFPTLTGPFPVGAGVRLVYSLAVPLDAPLNGVGAPFNLVAQEV